jgi:cobalt-precorrin 5A hydrolase
MAGGAVIVAGFGFRRTATRESLRDALERAADGLRPDLLATAADKAYQPVFRALAAELGVGATGIGAARLAVQQTRTQSEVVRASRGVGSLAEAAALSAAGKGARLIRARVVSRDGLATCALARGEQA